jgi:hypothetical protein
MNRRLLPVGRTRWICWLACAVFLCSCSSRGSDWAETVPVTGVVHVDGKPVEGVLVTLHRSDIGNNQNLIPSTAFSDAAGKFAISTYENGDGAPLGEYTATFTWPTINVVSMQYDGDRLNKRYDDRKASKTSVQVQSGKPVDLGNIELTTK